MIGQDDPSQDGKDELRYERLFSRPVTVISMGRAGHAAALVDAHRYMTWLNRALT